MKARVTKKLTVHIETTLDSSEAIMFNQGGLHKMTIPINDIISEDLMREMRVYTCASDECDEPKYNIDIILSIQIDRDQMGRHTWITKEAEKAKEAGKHG